MVCTGIGTNVIICGPGRRFRRYVDHCEWCDARTRHVKRYDGLHYGYTYRCLSCGVCTQDGYNIETDRTKAQEWWAEAMPPRDFDRLVKQDWESLE